VVVLFAQCGVPVHLVSEGVPGEADNRNPMKARLKNIGPLLP
jgi:hypothetical protein